MRANGRLRYVGLEITRTGRKRAPTREFRAQLQQIKRTSNVPVFADYWDEAGDHPADHADWECGFAAQTLYRIRPQTVLDVGSYRHFVIGLLAGYDVTSLDVRARSPACAREKVVTSDAKASGVPRAGFDAIVSLCAIEHFGLGRYGDAFDLDGDAAAIREWRRLLKPGGSLVLTTTFSASGDALAFNAHRIYGAATLREFAKGFVIREERLYSTGREREIPLSEATRERRRYDVYGGWWQTVTSE
jgi:SAM-dependent methyltransferase